MTNRLRATTIAALILLIVAVALYASARRSQTPRQTFPAIVNRDCAPWDGSAFTVSIPMEGANISISVYQAPDIRFPATFVFPDRTMSIGNALLILPINPPEPLTGEVSFQSVQQSLPVKGAFHLNTEAGKKIEGKFVAEWGNEMIYCG